MIKKCILLVVSFILLSFSILAIPGFYYEVKSGDNLEFISKITHTPMQVIIEWNQWIAFRKYLYPGDRIFIPYKPVIIYEVKSGDNLTLIALRFFTTVKDIMKMNNIKDPNKIYVGQRLLIDYYSVGKFFDMKHVISWPIFGEITSEYGWRIHPIFKKRSFHHGVDIAAPEGTPIFAATSGKVIEVGKDNGFGIYVKIRSYKYTYMYAHLSKVSVSKGMIVKKGELIGRVGSTGLSTGPHLHFQIEDRNQKTYNPLVFLPSIKYVYKNIKERYYIGGK